MRKLLLPVILFLTFLCGLPHGVQAQNELDQKLMMGYQGWFLCKGDNSAPNEWRHWFQSLSDPSVSQLNVDMWPDMSEYTTTYATSMNYPNGTNARLFSSHDASTTNLHFKWMQDYNVYGVYLQRFLGEAVNDPRFFQVRNNVLQNVINASATYNRHFSIMYDISGVADDGNLYNKLVTDWEYLVNTYNVTNKPGYVKQEGKPVIAIWGIGFEGRGLKPETFQQLINYFHNNAAPQYRAYVVGGVPDSWRTLNNDADPNPAWTSVYHSLDMISPWAVGRYGNVTEADNWKTNKIIPDMSDCNANGVDYMPVIFPGFSWYNMHDGASNTPLNQIPRAGGNFYWRQAYNAISAGSKFVYVAMFDEVDEGTAMFKLAATNTQAPSGASLVTMDEDGQSLPSDWYLRLANETQKMLSGTSPLSQTIPISPNGNVPVITSAGTASGSVGAAFSYTITATNSPTSYGATGLPGGLSVNTSTGVINGTPTSSGNFNTTITASNSSGQGSKALTISISGSQGTQGPIGGTPWAIPGIVEGENFDTGGEGVAYHDNDALNAGGQGRTGDGVDTETASEGTLNVGWTNTGEWLEYTVNVASAGNYNFDVRVATPNTGGSLHIEFGGVNKTGAISVPTTGGWQTWASVTKTGVTLSAGVQVMRIYFDNANFNLNKVTISAVSGGQNPYPGPSAQAIPGTIQAENFDTGGEGVAYHDVDAANTGAQYRASEGVDIEACSEGGFNVGWLRNTEWLEYTVNISTSSAYTMQARVSSGLSGKTFHVEIDGANVSGPITVPNTGGWQNWQTVTVSIPSLTAGQRTLKISIDSDDFNLNYIAFALSGGGPPLNCPASGTQGIAYNFTQPTYTASTVSYGATGLPSGLSVNSSNGTISGTPTVCGTFNVTLSATTPSGTGTKACSLIINCVSGPPVINNTSLPSASVGSAYSTSISATNSPTSYGATGLPLGLSVNTSTGAITGTPTRPGNYSVALSATNSSGTGTKTLSLSVSEPAGVVSALRPSSIITVNGSLSETSWNLSKSVAKNTVGTGNNTTTFGVLWDNTNLYIGIKILDANLFSDSPNAWEDDAIEIYIDANNNKLASYDGSDNQFIKNYNKSTIFMKVGISGLQHAWAAISGGYSIELAVPWSQLGISAPANGTKVGFDVGYDDDDNGGARDAQAVWNGTVNNYQNTSGFGTIVLSSATAGSPLARSSSVKALEHEEGAQISYWPTEVSDILHIISDGSFDHVEIFDLVGRSQIRKTIIGKTTVELDVTTLAGGLHIVKMNGQTRSHGFRIIKK